MSERRDDARDGSVEQGPAVPGADASMDGNHQNPASSVPAERDLPVDSLKAAAAHLRRPFMPEALKFKVQAGIGGDKKANKPPTAGIVVPYIDARLVVERLNLVCPHLWEEPEYERLDENHLLCRLTIDGKTRADVGQKTGGSDSGVGADPIKALYSDAFKRAAVKFGVGVSVYALPQIFLKVGEGLELTAAKKLRLPDKTLERLRGGYKTWLEADGKHFGEPLSHGDTLTPLAGEAFEETGIDGDDQEDAAGPVEGPEADGLRERIVAAYDELREIDKAIVKPAEYGKLRRDADVSVEGLVELAAQLEAKLAEAKKAPVAA